MLTNIFISHYALIRSLELNINQRMTAFTGETGAGKSIIIDALALVLGARYEGQEAKKRAEPSEIFASFALDDTPIAKQWLAEHALLSDDNECILRRVISPEGRSKCYINGKPATLQSVRELGVNLISIHGQHQQQHLLRKEHHQQLLDDFAGTQKKLSEVKDLAERWHACNKKIQQIKNDNTNRQDRAAYLNYQLQELETIIESCKNLKNIEQDHKQLANADELIQQTQNCLDLLGGDHEHNVNKNLNDICQQLMQAQQHSPPCANALSLMQQAMLQLDEAEVELKNLLAELNPDPEQLQQLDKVLTKIYDLARKHHISAKQLPELYENMQQEFSELNNHEAHLENLEQELNNLFQAYNTAAAKLTSARQLAASKLTKQVLSNLRQLDMSAASFKICFSEEDKALPHPYGAEKIEFKIATNPGQDHEAIDKLASGGELSRISLAIQVITANKHATPTLIFDEVDTGIGGRIAEIVGQLLRNLSDKAQVLCITHLPQVAAQAHHHVLVSKHKQENQHSTEAHHLSQQEKVEELARMLAGVKVSAQAKEHAKEMLARID